MAITDGSHRSNQRATSFATLLDGRRLAYEEFGDPQGPPVFYFHGWPGARVEFAANHGAAGRAGARVIAVDRPGIGRSDHLHDRTVLGWADDVATLADALDIDRFVVCGFSFGGPYARACAYALPDRVIRAGLISCLGAADSKEAVGVVPPATRMLGARGSLVPVARDVDGPTHSQALARSHVHQVA